MQAYVEFYINTIVFAHRTHADILIIDPCVSGIPIAAPDVQIHQARVKVTQSKQSRTNDTESFVRKVCYGGVSLLRSQQYTV